MSSPFPGSICRRVWIRQGEVHQQNVPVRDLGRIGWLDRRDIVEHPAVVQQQLIARAERDGPQVGSVIGMHRALPSGDVPAADGK
jgi:hypothetical protein